MLSPSGVGFMVVYMQVFGDTLGQQSKKFRTFLFANCRKKYQYEKKIIYSFSLAVTDSKRDNGTKLSIPL